MRDEEYLIVLSRFLKLKAYSLQPTAMSQESLLRFHSDPMLLCHSRIVLDDQ